MRPALVIGWRDYRSAFDSPFSYVLIAAFLLITGAVFVWSLLEYSVVSEAVRQASIQDPRLLDMLSVEEAIVGPLLRWLAIMLLVLVPLLTMRLFAEEKRTGTIELLLTAPVTAGQLVAGKFLGGLALCLTPVLLTGWYPVVLGIIAQPEPLPLLLGYLGLVLTAAAFTAVGLLASTLTDVPLLSAFLALVALLMTVIAGVIAESMDGPAAALIGWFSIFRHFDTLRTGVLDTADLAFFACFTAGVLVLALRVVESRRWR